MPGLWRVSNLVPSLGMRPPRIYWLILFQGKNVDNGQQQVVFRGISLRAAFYFSLFQKASRGFVVAKYVPTRPVLGKNCQVEKLHNVLLFSHGGKGFSSPLSPSFLPLIFRK